MKKILLLFFLVGMINIAAADSSLDGTTTQDGVNNLMYLSLGLFAFSLIWIKVSDCCTVVSAVSMLIAGLVSFDIANTYINGTLVAILPDSTIQSVHNPNTSAIFQFLGLVMTGMFVLQTFLIAFAKKKHVFVHENFGEWDND